MQWKIDTFNTVRVCVCYVGNQTEAMIKAKIKEHAFHLKNLNLWIKMLHLFSYD